MKEHIPSQGSGFRLMEGGGWLASSFMTLTAVSKTLEVFFLLAPLLLKKLVLLLFTLYRTTGTRTAWS